MDDNTLQLLARLDERSKNTLDKVNDIKTSMRKLPTEDTVKVTISEAIDRHIAAAHVETGSNMPFKVILAALGLVATALSIIMIMV